MANYTDSLGLEEITPGDQAGLWGNTTNNNLALIDQAVTGVTPISFTGVSGTTKTLDDANGALNEARAAVLNITGIATGPNTVVVPNKQKTYLVRNNTGQNVIFRTASPGSTYSVDAGNSILIFCDGGNNVFTGIQSPSAGTLSVSAGGTGSTTFTAGFIKSTGGTNALTSASSVNLNSGDVTGTLQVASGGTGQTSIGTAGQALVSNGAAYVPTNTVNTISAGTGISISGSAGAFTISASGGTGVTSVSGTGSVSGITLSGTVTSTGSLTLGGSLTLTSGQVTSALGYTPVSSGTLASYALLSGATFTGDVVRSSGGFSALQSNSVVLGNSITGIFNTGSSNFGFQTGGSSVLFIAAGTGSVTNISGSYTAISDERVKENITPARNYLDDLCQLNVVNYNLLGKTETYLGLIAQEVQTVLPGLVEANAASAAYPDVPNLLSVKYSVLVPMLLQAVQELKAGLDAANAEIAALKAN